MPTTTRTVRWRNIRRAYEESAATVATIARRHGIDRSTIARHAKAHGWTLRLSGRAMLLHLIAEKQAAKLLDASPGLIIKAFGIDPSKSPADPPTPLVTRRSRTGGGTPTHRRKLLAQIYDILDAKLRQLEGGVAAHGDFDVVIGEREARLLTSLLKTYETLVDIAHAETAAAARTSADPAADDDRKLRADILARYERLRGQGGVHSAAAAAQSARAAEPCP